MNCCRSAFESAEKRSGTSRGLRVPPARTVWQTLSENGRGKTDGRDSMAMGDTAIASLRGVPAERSDKKCTLRRQRRRQLYLSRREISSPNGLRANSGVGRTSGRLRSAIKRSQKPQGGKRGERRKSFSRGGKPSNDSLG